MRTWASVSLIRGCLSSSICGSEERQVVLEGLEVEGITGIKRLGCELYYYYRLHLHRAQYLGLGGVSLDSHPRINIISRPPCAHPP